MTFGERIFKVRTEKGLTQSELANRAGYKSRSTIAKIESGERDAPQSMIVALAKALGTTPSYLMGWDDNEKPIENNTVVLPQDKIRMIPVYESVSAGFGAYADNYIVEYMPLYIFSNEEAANTMCIMVKGDSMFPKIEDGDKIQVLKQDWAENGQVVVALIDGDNAVVKKIEYTENSIRLISFNPEYIPREFVGPERDRIKIIGVVKTVIKQL